MKAETVQSPTVSTRERLLRAAADLSAVTREQVLRAITTGGGGEIAAATDIVSQAVRLGEAGTAPLTVFERALLADCLDRMAHAAEASPAVRNAPRRRDGGDGQP
jgi:hypothetical protein